MTEIPDDVMKAAVEYTNETLKFGGVRGEVTTIGIDATINVIARAILAERERCAKVALLVQSKSDNYNGAYDGAQDVIDGINNS